MPTRIQLVLWFGLALLTIAETRWIDTTDHSDGTSAMTHRAKRHHHRHHHETIDLIDPMKQQQQEEEEDERIAQFLRGKRHNRRRAWTDKDRKSFNDSRVKLHVDNEKAYELEVREAQNSSLCNYTVIPIPDPGGRIPKELDHVKCNHVGSKCQDKGTYCCIQTYRYLQVAYEDGREETLKVYSGCICSLQIYGTLEPYNPDVDVDD